MAIHLHAKRFKAAAESDGTALLFVAREHYAANVKAEIAKCIDQAKHVLVISDAKVASDFIFLNIGRVDGNHDLYVVFDARKHLDLTVGSKAGKYAGCMKIVEKLAAKLEIELAAKLLDALGNLL